MYILIHVLCHPKFATQDLRDRQPSVRRVSGCIHNNRVMQVSYKISFQVPIMLIEHFQNGPHEPFTERSVLKIIVIIISLLLYV